MSTCRACSSQRSACTCTPRDCGCETTLTKLEDLLRGELCAQESALIREHLRKCSECRAEQRVCVALTEAIKRGCADKAPPQLRDAILALLRV